MSDEISRARATLLRVLDQLEKAEEDLGGPVERADLVIVYAIGRNQPDGWHDVGGWVSTPGPKWAQAALLRMAADAQDEAVYGKDDPPEDDE